MNLSKMSTKELSELSDQIQAELPKRRKAAIKAVRDQAAALAGKHGLTLNDILTPAGKVRGKKRDPKWLDEKTGVTWEGRGRRPLNFDMRRAVAL